MKAPVAMPDMYIVAQQFEVERIDYGSPEASGRINGVQAGFPLWRAVYTLGRMTEVYSDTWRAWVAGLRGATRRFIARPVERPYPTAHPDGFAAFSPFTGAASDWSQTIAANGDAQLTLNLGADAEGLILSPGDYIDFRYTATETTIAGLAWRAIVRVLEGDTADSSGDLTVIVDPPVPDAVPDTAVAHLDNPGCVMVLMGDSSLGAIDVLKTIQGGQIGAIQDLRA